MVEVFCIEPSLQRPVVCTHSTAYIWKHSAQSEPSPTALGKGGNLPRLVKAIIPKVVSVLEERQPVCRGLQPKAGSSEKSGD